MTAAAEGYMKEFEADVMMNGFDPLHGMLEMVAFKRVGICPEADLWVETVRANFSDIGVDSVRDFLVSVLEINTKLSAAGLPKLANATLTMMLKEVCEMIAGPDEKKTK